MRVSIDGTCRGSGKVYTRFEVNGLGEGQTLVVREPNINGVNVPCAIYEVQKSDIESPSRYFVGAFPIIKRTSATYVIEAVDEDGSVADTYRYRLNYEIAKWQSRINYRLNKQLTDEIRDYDQVVAYDKADMEFWEAIDAGDSYILRCAVYTPYRDDTELELTVFNESLEPVSISPIPFGVTQIATRFSSKRTRREAQFSIKLPNVMQKYIFRIRDKNHASFENFAVLDDAVLGGMLKFHHELRQHAQNDPRYTEWLKEHKAKPGDLSKQRDIDFPVKPLFSIIVPLFNTPIDLFKAMGESVLNQSYQNWELILVNASPENTALNDAIDKLKAQDHRIVSIQLESNLGISENTNRGIAIANGDFISFFDHDDVLEPDLLFSYAEAINDNEEIDLLYCDEDKLMPDGTYTHPFFKPDFDLELLRNNNYICHMLTIRKNLLDQLDPNTKEFDGAQDHNMTLQAVEKARCVHHVPRVLYHWRICETSTASDANSKPYASEAGIRAVRAHLDRMGVKGSVSVSRRPFTYKVTYDVPAEHPLVSIVIPTKDQVEILDTCIQSILNTSTYDNYEIILVENNSTETRTFEYYDRICSENPSRISVAHWEYEFNFSKLMNFGEAAAHGDYLLLLNNDTEVITPNWIEILLGICSQPSVGVVGAKLYFPDDTIQHAGVVVGGGVAGHLAKNYPRSDWGYFALLDAQRELSAVTAACIMTKRSTFKEVEGFTEELQVAFNDIDYCLKVREAGERIIYTPEVELYHYESISRGSDEINSSKKIRFAKECAYMSYRWAEHYVKGDPYMNPNFEQTMPGAYYNWLSA